ncbi:Neurogenic protein mastermind [Apis cerana cerana]|uniref:Neurogenic protein mastermind n=1 Tax=Apis cerana cerana TaxID=94128 RepID=A0A2A3EKJ2_APICC|nr:Neurogenic protein mastermind [Apis cerana cerana]
MAALTARMEEGKHGETEKKKINITRKIPNFESRINNKNRCSYSDHHYAKEIVQTIICPNDTKLSSLDLPTIIVDRTRLGFLIPRADLRCPNVSCALKLFLTVYTPDPNLEDLERWYTMLHAQTDTQTADDLWLFGESIGRATKRDNCHISNGEECFYRICLFRGILFKIPTKRTIEAWFDYTYTCPRPCVTDHVSAGQHMQLTGDLKPGVSVAAQQGMYFSQQQTQNQSAGQTDTYCSKLVYNVESPRDRSLKGVMQQQQHMAGGMGGVRPPPPEYKAAQAQMMHAGIGMAQQARFPNTGPMRRVTQQPMPPSETPTKNLNIEKLFVPIVKYWTNYWIITSKYENYGPMMRPQMAQQQQQALHAAGGNMYMGGGSMAAIGGMHQMHQRLGYPRTNNQRPPNVSVGPPDGLGNSIAGRGAQQEWRHVLMQQQGFQAQMRSQFNQQGHQGGFGMGGTGGMQMNAAQMQHQQLIRSQSGGIAGSGMGNSTQMQQLLSQQHQQQTLAMQQSNNQMSLQMQMSQSSSVNSVSSTGTGSPLHPHQQYGAGSPGVRSLPQQQQQHAQPPVTTTTDPSVTAADFSLEFLENLPTGDTSNFSAQELLNSLDSTGGFNLDILLRRIIDVKIHNLFLNRIFSLIDLNFS